jgi:DNA-directed RNA polymerase specialized sigma24 family protein
MLYDGYGDEVDYTTLTREDALQLLLPDRRRWLSTVAFNMTNSRVEAEDLMQEGMIAMWRAFDSYDLKSGIPLASWLQTKARYRMIDVRNGKSDFGQTGSQGNGSPISPRGVEARKKIREALAKHPQATGKELAELTGLSESTVSVQRKKLNEDVEPPKGFSSLEALLDEGFDLTSADLVIEQVITGYHEGEILLALNSLTDAERKYTVLRFWGGMQSKELKAEFGYDPHSLWKTAKAKLEQALSHLIDA